jgi:imidazolonepropionase
VAKAGGGIVNTTTNTRKASVQELVTMALPRVKALLNEGVTTLEIKSGYGLDVDGERKMLQAARAIGHVFSDRLDVRATYLGAHAIPNEYKGEADRYIDEVVCPQIPILHAEGLVDAVDVFCESIGFRHLIHFASSWRWSTGGRPLACPTVLPPTLAAA